MGSFAGLMQSGNLLILLFLEGAAGSSFWKPTPPSPERSSETSEFRSQLYPGYNFDPLIHPQTAKVPGRGPGSHR